MKLNFGEVCQVAWVGPVKSEVGGMCSYQLHKHVLSVHKRTPLPSL
jgi:hypothetical protein